MKTIKRNEGTKNVSCKNMQNVGLVECATKNTCTGTKNQLVKKLQKQGGSFLDITTCVQSPQVAIRFKVHWIHYISPCSNILQHQDTLNTLSPPYIWQHFDTPTISGNKLYSETTITQIPHSSLKFRASTVITTNYVQQHNNNWVYHKASFKYTSMPALYQQRKNSCN